MVKKKTSKPYIENSMCCDGSFVWTNNMSEWQIKHTDTEEVISHQKVMGGSPNVAEFLAIVESMVYQKSTEYYVPIYTDSQIALKWVEDGKCRTRASLTEELKDLVSNYENYLKVSRNDHKVLKWNTKEWGEIPADFGRKKKKKTKKI